MTTREIYLAAVGDANDPATWSGIPYHFLQAASAQGLLSGGLQLDVRGLEWQRRRIAWSLKRLARGIRPGGFQYSEEFLEALWRGVEPLPKACALVNCFQLYPRSISKRGEHRLYFYLDQTLHQVLDYYGHSAQLAAATRRDALAREREQYLMAEHIVMQSEWAAASVCADYGISRSKVSVALPGANLDRSALAAWESRRAGLPRAAREGPLKLVFVGKEWERKGLDRLIRALATAQGRGCEVELVVIVVKRETVPRDLRDVKCVTWLGFIDKTNRTGDFIATLEQCDVGCLLSRREAGGISLLEFARLGLPTLAPDTGGSPELVHAGATHLIAPEAADDEVADIIANLANNRDLLERQRLAAWESRLMADWSAACAGWTTILNGIALSLEQRRKCRS